MKRTNGGFTLIELMIVVTIIGVLAAIAIPNFRTFQARSKQSEAKMMLKAIFTAQKAYAAEAGKYAGDFKTIGFAPESGNRYSYGLVAGCAVAQPTSARGTTCIGQDQARYPIAPAPLDPAVDIGLVAGEFIATAQGNIDGDAQPDTWVITSAGSVTLQNTGCNETSIATSSDPVNAYNDAACP